MSYAEQTGVLAGLTEWLAGRLEGMNTLLEGETPPAVDQVTAALNTVLTFDRAMDLIDVLLVDIDTTSLRALIDTGWDLVGGLVTRADAHHEEDCTEATSLEAKGEQFSELVRLQGLLDHTPVWAGLRSLIRTRSALCDGLLHEPDPGVIITLTPPEATIAVGDTLELDATMTARDGTTLTGELDWSTVIPVGESLAAAVNDTGTVTGERAGTNQIDAASHVFPDLTGTAEVTVESDECVVSVQILEAGAVRGDVVANTSLYPVELGYGQSVPAGGARIPFLLRLTAPPSVTAYVVALHGTFTIGSYGTYLQAAEALDADGFFQGPRPWPSPDAAADSVSTVFDLGFVGGENYTGRWKLYDTCVAEWDIDCGDPTNLWGGNRPPYYWEELYLDVSFYFDGAEDSYPDGASPRLFHSTSLPTWVTEVAVEPIDASLCRR
jgi:hypothetical protein